MTDTFDPDVIAAAKAIYGNRLDQKYGGNRRWRQLVADYPQLAEAAKPVAVQRSNGPKSEIDHWRDEQEQIHRHMEAWARSQTPSRKKYYYRGKSSVLHDANYTTPGYGRVLAKVVTMPAPKVRLIAPKCAGSSPWSLELLRPPRHPKR
jgi:hypothetical protein